MKIKKIKCLNVLIFSLALVTIFSSPLSLYASKLDNNKYIKFTQAEIDYFSPYIEISKNKKFILTKNAENELSNEQINLLLNHLKQINSDFNSSTYSATENNILEKKVSDNNILQFRGQRSIGHSFIRWHWWGQTIGLSKDFAKLIGNVGAGIAVSFLGIGWAVNNLPHGVWFNRLHSGQVIAFGWQ